MKTVKGLNPLCTIIDVEKYCRENYNHIKNRANLGNINLDYAEGIKEILRDILENYFGGI